jgi:uncharacterized protein
VNSLQLDPSFKRGLKFSCTRCGACCRHVGDGIGLREKDIDRLGAEKGSKLNHPIFSETLPSSAGICLSLTESSECEIYSKRPLVCRLYPFYLSIRGNGSVQISLDHCPGVNQPDSGDIIDQDYIAQEIFPALQDDPEFIVELKQIILGVKGNSYALASGKVWITWEARKTLWSKLLELVEANLGPKYSPWDALEVLKVDVVPFITETLEREYSGVVDEESIWLFLSDIRSRIGTIVLESRKNQESFRNEIQKEGKIVSSSHDSEPSSQDETVFHTRTGDRFSVNSQALLQMREIESGAIRAEVDYLAEVVYREFVYAGILFKPLSLQQEVSLLFYLADAIELIANALAIQENRNGIDSSLVNRAICEVDATILSTVQLLGGKVAVSFE